MPHRIRTLLAALVVAALTGLLAASPAAAAVEHDFLYAYHGDDRAFADIGYDPPAGADWVHRRVGIQDFECDGDKVIVQWYFNGSNTLHSEQDPDGCGSGYWSATYGTGIRAFRACEFFTAADRWGCGGWVYPHNVVYA